LAPNIGILKAAAKPQLKQWSCNTYMHTGYARPHATPTDILAYVYTITLPLASVWEKRKPALWYGNR